MVGRSCAIACATIPVMKLFAAALVTACVFAPNLAEAFFDPPWITPDPAHTNDPISVNIRAGVCDGIFDTVGYPQITRDGTSVRLLLAGSHYEQGSELCTFGTGTAMFVLGTFPAGDYTLQVDLDYDHFPFGPDTMTIGVVPFEIRGVDPVTEALPSLSTSGVIALVTVLMLGGVHSLAPTIRFG